MVLASRPWNCCREEHSRSIPNKRLDKLFGACFWKMLSNCKALNQILLPTEIDRSGQIGTVETGGVDEQLVSVEEGYVHAGHCSPGFGPHVQPRTPTTAKIDDATDRKGCGQP